MIHHEFSTFTPESFNVTQKCLKEESSPSPSVASVIAVLRLAHFDTDVFMKFKQVLIERGGYAGSSVATRKDILFDLRAVRSQYYPIKSTYDVCFELARIHMGIKVGDRERVQGRSTTPPSRFSPIPTRIARIIM